jgi:2-C-methyl-D-erythritol 4-phosphate cytidylyltransferase
MATFSVLFLTTTPSGYPADSNGPFVKVDGRECLLRSVELFLNRDPIKQLQLCFTPEMMEEGKRKYGGHLGFSGVKLVGGGPRWIDQIAAGAEKLATEVSHVILHDAARPAVAYDDIDALMDAATKRDAVALAAACRTSLVEVDEGGNPMAIHPASRFMQVLTPQVFSKARFLEMAKTRQEPHPSQFALLKGSSLNVRAGGGTEPTLVRAMLQLLPKPKVRPASSPFEEAQW